MMNKMDELDDENGLSLQKFKAQFGKHTVPADLLQLYDFGKKHGHYNYSENFYLGNFDKRGLKTYSKNGTFINAFIEFAGANGTGSSYGFWVLNEDLNECPVVIFGDEGGIQVIAGNFRQLLQLLSFDHEPSVSYDEVSFYFDEEDEDYEHSESHEEYVLWLQLNFGLQPITTDEETELIIEKAQQKYQKQLNEFIAQYEFKEVDYTILDTSAIQLVPFDAVKHFIAADSWMIKNHERGDVEYQNVLFIDGDWIIDNIDLADPFHGLNENQIKLYSETASLFIINGNLKAKNIYSSNDDGAFGLIVTGNAEANNMVVGGSDIIINNNLKIKDLFWGSYNHGSLTVENIVSARVFISSEEYYFEYIPRKMEVEMYLEDPELEEDKELMAKLADKFFASHLLQFDIDEIYEEEFENIESWSDILYRNTIINVLKTGDPILKSDFTDSTNYFEEEEDVIPNLFQDTTFKNKESFDLQFDNFQKVLSFFKDEKGGPRYYFKLPEINASVMIMTEDGTKQKISDGSKVAIQNIIMVDIHKDSEHFSAGDEFMIWRQKEETGFKTLFKKPKYDYTNKDGKSMFVFLVRDPDHSFYKYRIAFELCKVEALQKIWDLVLETIEKGVYYKNKYETFVKPAAITSMLQLPMIVEKYPNSWNDSDQCPWFGNSCYSFFQGTDTNFPAIKIVKEIDNINNDFDAKSYYYWFDTNIQKATLGYLANYHELNDPLYDMRYSKESEGVPFYHYPLYQEAIKLWKKALVVLPNENERYVAKKKSEYQMEFSETEVEYRKYYIEKPITENKLADLTYENFNILANYCETCDRSYTYDFFVIIRDYHWISVKLTDVWSLHSVTQKKALKFIFLDEPFGNDTENENYAALKYNVEIDVNNYLSYFTNAETDVDAEKNIQFLLFQLLKDIKKTAPYFIIPNNAEAAQDELNSTIKKNQEQIFGSRFIKSKKDNGGFWENGIWDKDYFYSFQVWEENNLDIRISWTHPEKSQLDNLSNNMQVATIRFNKDTKQITYYFQTTFENDIAIENFEFDLNQIEKIVIGYHLMMQKVKLESESLKEINKKIAKKRNYQVTKPFDKIEIDGITFTLKDRLEATEILDQCTDFDNEKVYDPFYISHLENDEEDYKSFFLVAENEVIAEKLNLDTYPPDSEDIYILGYIFLKNIILNKYVEAYDLDFSPPLICMDDVEIGSLLLAGNTFYFHKNLKCVNLHGEYNHGNLIAKGRTDADFIFADDFNMKFNEPSMVVSCSSDSDIEKINDLSTLDLNIDYELNYLPAMHNLQHCVQDRFIYLDGEYGYRIKDEGYRTGINQYAEDEETFFDCLRKGESVLDYEKLETNRTMFIANAFAIAKGMFAKHDNLKDLALGEVYYLFPNPNYNHINFYFQETDEFYFIGYWNTWFNISISVGLHKSGEKDQHQLTVFYWNKENTATRYSFTVSMDEMTHYNNICQKVFIEAIERMG
ncbi:hypothetical protein [Flavobacterium sp.]|uniref:hypothetical protein n=1 Tax=Flavobacterium sp. TaxID=239 RepID=UPI002609B228|nr:hypothetical protein [Flavobacterium sp.]